MIKFELQGHDFIQLNQLLKLLNLVESGGEANQLIVAGEARVNGVKEFQKRRKLYPGDKVSVGGQEIGIFSS
ncbi:S4 domain protein [anaerobic digester metagenome]|nr:RNA-binding S4 domain-containing protein [Lentimicrobiaceae bacterium]